MSDKNKSNYYYPFPNVFFLLMDTVTSQEKRRLFTQICLIEICYTEISFKSICQVDEKNK